MHATWILLLLTWLAAPVDPPITPDRVVALFNRKDLSNWQPDVPARDIDPNVKPSFVVPVSYTHLTLPTNSRV